MSIVFGVYFHHLGTKQSNATIRHLQLNYGQSIKLNEEFERVTGLLPLVGKPFLRHKIREIKENFIKEIDEVINTSHQGEADLILSIKLDILDYLAKLTELSELLEKKQIPALGENLGDPNRLQELPNEIKKEIRYLVNARLDILKKLRAFTDTRKDFFKGSILYNKKVVKNQFLRNLIVSGVCLLIVLGLSISLFKRVHRPLVGFKDFADNLCKGAMDVTWKLPIEGQDEIKDLAKSLLKMRQNLKSMVVRNLYFTKLVTNSPGLVVIIKTNEGIQAVNNACLSTLNYTLGQMLNRGTDLLFEGNLEAEADKDFNQLIALCKNGPVDKVVYTKEGWPIPFLINVTDIDVMYDGDKTILITGQDVRTLRDLETGIKLQMAELEDREFEANELKKELEKKSSELALLYEKTIFPNEIEAKKYNFEQVDEALIKMARDYTRRFLEIEKIAQEISQSNALNSAETSENLIKLSRSGFEQIQKIIELRNIMDGDILPHLELNPILEETIDHLSTYSNKTIIFHSVLEPDLWFVDGNLEEIKRVFYCIIRNAQDASPEGGKVLVESKNIHLHLGDVEGLSRGDFLKIIITDYGTGIAKENLSHIFDHFYSTKAGGKEDLFGLSMAKKVIEEHQGIIQVKSELEKGSVFSIYLPRGGDPEKELSEEEESLIFEVTTHPEELSL